MTIKDLMDPVEQERYEAFCKKHKECEFTSTIGGKISVYITPTGLGYMFQCTCNGCDETEDITNVDNW
jgi:hypothetical protein